MCAEFTTGGARAGLSADEDAVTAVLREVRSLGIALALTDEKDGILAGPKELLTDEIRYSIHESRDGVIRQLLFAEALSYYQRHIEGTGGSRTSTAARAGYTELATNGEDLNAAFQDAGLTGFKETLRLWLKQGLAAYRHAHTGSGEPEPAPEQPTLIEAST